MTQQETICALSTAAVNGAIALIRMSGPQSLEAAHSLFTNNSSIEDRRAVFGSITDNGEIVDDVLLTFFKGPGSFTGEDMVEVSCHGNGIVVNRILSLMVRQGCRMAEPGEFTKRAFLNGKVDLTEAEAINQIITARSDWEIDTAINQMHGSFKLAVNELKQSITNVKADIESTIDFSDEDIDFATLEENRKEMADILQQLSDLRKRCSAGRAMARGFDTAIIGMPNVGKSSILNMLLNEERAIVSDIPGTTRDTIRESIMVGSIPVNIIDTAGIGEPGDEIERIGIEQSLKYIENASMLFVVFDGSRGMLPQEKKLLGMVSDKKVIHIINKADIAPAETIEDYRELSPLVTFSAKKAMGLHELEEALSTLLQGEFVDSHNSFIADVRMMEILDRAVEASREILQGMVDSIPVEMTASALGEIIFDLSEITGEVTPDDVLGSIFSRFCIGK